MSHETFGAEYLQAGPQGADLQGSGASNCAYTKFGYYCWNRFGEIYLISEP